MAATSIEPAKGLASPKVSSTNGSRRRRRFMMDAREASELKEEAESRFGQTSKKNFLPSLWSSGAKELKVKQYWFHMRAVQLMSELHPDVDFKFSPGWFDRFKARQKIS
jgi:hypothetical protein